MSKFQEFGVFPGSERSVFPGVEVGETPGDIPVSVMFHLRRKKALNHQHLAANKRFLSRQVLADEHGAALDDVRTVTEFAEYAGLEVIEADLCKRTVEISGPAQKICSVFKVKLVDRRLGAFIYHTRSGHIFLPKELLGGLVTGVFGLDNRPQARPHFRLAKGQDISSSKPSAFDGAQLAKIYNFPVSGGRGQTIGIICLGGGYRDADLADYFAAIDLPSPKVKAVSVGGATNRPGRDDSDTEVALDIEVSASVAIDANIVLYFAENTDKGFLQAILEAIHDAQNKPNILSISWGNAEINWSRQSILAMDHAFKSAAALGISVFVAAGDDGCTDGVRDGLPYVDFPASSPWTTACGGTSLTFANGIRQESVWNDGANSATGGGISGELERPPYQQGLSIPLNLNGTLQGRALPDISAAADPEHGYAVLVGGCYTIVGGTSAAAPLFAGLMARLNEISGRSHGLINPVLYENPGSAAFNDIVGGNNSCDGVTGYASVAGWDPVTGWGSVNGANLLQLLERQNSP